MANKYLKVGTNGRPTEQEALATSSGAGDAGKIIATDAGGKLDSSFMPAGFGSNTDSIASSENLAAGDWVNIYDNGGTINCRKADNSNGRLAHGFVLAGVTSPAAATVYGPGELNNQASGMTVGGETFLATGGGETASVPSGSGVTIQSLGVAKSATEIRFNPQVYAVLA
jgi:hypothetical protein